MGLGRWGLISQLLLCVKLIIIPGLSPLNQRDTDIWGRDPHLPAAAWGLQGLPHGLPPLSVVFAPPLCPPRLWSPFVLPFRTGKAGLIFTAPGGAVCNRRCLAVFLSANGAAGRSWGVAVGSLPPLLPLVGEGVWGRAARGAKELLQEVLVRRAWPSSECLGNDGSGILWRMSRELN